MGLYENVRELCRNNNTSIFALEDKLGFPRSSICKWNENIPSIAKVKKVADEFGVAIDSLAQNVDFPAKQMKNEDNTDA